MGEAQPQSWAQSPLQSPSPGSTPAGSHGTRPAPHTRSRGPAGPCLPPALTTTPSAPSLHPPAADPSSSPCSHYYLAQASTDTPSTPWELNYPPCRWKYYATASLQRFSSRLAECGLRAATMELPGLPATEQAPGAALDLPITWYLPAADASLGHGSSALPYGRDRTPAPTVLPPTPLTHPSHGVFAGDSSAPSLLSYCHRERCLQNTLPPGREGSSARCCADATLVPTVFISLGGLLKVLRVRESPSVSHAWGGRRIPKLCRWSL